MFSSVFEVEGLPVWILSSVPSKNDLCQLGIKIISQRPALTADSLSVAQNFTTLLQIPLLHFVWRTTKTQFR